MSENIADYEPSEPEVQWSILKVKYAGRCITCGDWILPGEMAEWAKECGIRHQEHDGQCICVMPDGSWRYAI